MLTSQEAIIKFQIPITTYSNIGLLQQLLLSYGSTINNTSMAALRCLDTFFKSEIKSLLALAVEPVLIVNFTDDFSSLQDMADKLVRFFGNGKIAISEAKNFLPPPTIDIISEYYTGGDSIHMINVMTFLVMTANL